MASITPYETKNGKFWQVRYRDPNRKQRKKKGFKTKRDATEWSNRIEVDKLQGSYINPTAGKITVADVGKEWKTSLIDVSYSWRERQISIWNVHVLPYWGARRINQITTSDVQDWVTTKASADRESEPLSPKSIQLILGVLASVLDRAVDARRIASNPARGKIRMPRKMSEEMIVLTPNQVHMLAKQVPREYATVTWLLITSGIRWGELAALRPRDIRDNNRLHLSRSYSKTNSKLVLKDLKNHENRTVIVLPTIHKMIQSEAAGTNRENLIWEAPRKGGPLRPPSSGHWFDSAIKRCHALDDSFPQHLPIHSLRHTAASLMISSGANVKVIQRQLGHKSAAMTLDRYGHFMDDDLDVVADSLERRLSF